MEKLMYLVWLEPGATRREVASIGLDRMAPELLALQPHGLTMDIDDESADVPPPVPPPEGEDGVRVIVSLWIDAYDWREPYERVLQRYAHRLAGYQVVESLYSDYGRSRWAGPRDWPDGQRSPGILTVAMFEQKSDMELEEWLTFWHERQSPMSEAVQPRCRYVRNAVFRAVTPGAPPYRGIVEEAWPSAGHVVDPMLFYCGEGDEARMRANIATMIEHVTTFMDLATMRSVTMSEWILKSVGGDPTRARPRVSS